MTELIDLVIRYGIPLVFVNVFAEQIGAPIPAVPTLIVAGALARDGHFSTSLLVIVATAASLLADCLWYVLGRSHGYRVLRLLCRVSLSPDSCVRQTEANFERWGLKSLLFAKFIPGFSTVAPPLAGATKRRLGEFLLYDTIGSLIWVGVAVAAGHVFHKAIDRALLWLEDLGWWGGVAIGAALVLVIGFKWWQRARFLKQLRMARVSVDELKAMFDRGVVPLVVDARSEAGRKSDPRRIPNALNLENLAGLVAQSPPTREIILYCT